jgi:hypothetical protein
MACVLNGPQIYKFSIDVYKISYVLFESGFEIPVGSYVELVAVHICVLVYILLFLSVFACSYQKRKTIL